MALIVRVRVACMAQMFLLVQYQPSFNMCGFYLRCSRRRRAEPTGLQAVSCLLLAFQLENTYGAIAPCSVHKHITPWPKHKHKSGAMTQHSGIMIKDSLFISTKVIHGLVGLWASLSWP